MDIIKICLLVTTVLHHHNGVSGNDNIMNEDDDGARRMYMPGEGSVIIGAPSYAYHLPEAEAILPGHTLIRPSLGMLKSSIKFPHRELENGAGVYGSYDNLGIKYDGKNERVLYTGFRRSQDDAHESKTKVPNLKQLLRIVKSFNQNNQLEQNDHGEEKPALVELIERLKNGRFNQESIEKNIDHNEIGDTSLKKYLRSVVSQALRQQDHVQVDTEKPSVKQYLRTIKSRIYDTDTYQNDIENLDTKKYLRSFTMLRQGRPLKYITHQRNESPIELKESNIKEQKPSQVIIASDVIGKTNIDKVLRIINSLRRDQELRSNNKTENGGNSTKIVAKYPDDEESEKKRMTDSFWNTKDAFNHVRISAEAPDHVEFLPAEADDDVRKWWFYLQSDFEDFES